MALASPGLAQVSGPLFNFTHLAGPTEGSGTADGTGQAARFSRPGSMTMDQYGNIILVDATTVRRMTPQGLVTTLAGKHGPVGHEDGPVSSARFGDLGGVAVDAAGNIFVSDNTHHTIRKISLAGVVTTLAGAAGEYGMKDAAGSAARFESPRGIAINASGELFVCDSGNEAIRKVSPNGVVTTFSPAVNPSGIAVDSSGNLYVTNRGAPIGGDSVSKIGPAGGTTTVAGSGLRGSADGAPGQAGFFYPAGIAVLSNGDIYVADWGNSTVRKIVPGTAVTTVGGKPGELGWSDGAPSVARFFNPSGIAADPAGNLYVSDTSNHTVRKISSNGVISTVAGMATPWGSADGTGTAARFTRPRGLDVDAAGNLYVADGGNHVIRKVAPNGSTTTLAGKSGESGAADGSAANARFGYPTDVATDGAGNVYVADAGNNIIRRISPAGVVTTVAGTAGLAGRDDGAGPAARFKYPSGIGLGRNGELYIADAWNHVIRKMTPAGVVTTVAGTVTPSNVDGRPGAFHVPSDVAVAADGSLYVADNLNYTIRRVLPDGTVETIAGKWPSPSGSGGGVSGSADGTGSDATFGWISHIAVDRSGMIYVTDSGNTVRRITPAGAVTTIGGLAGVPGTAEGVGSTARFDVLDGIAIDALGNLYVSDTGSHAIRKGTLTTLALGPSSRNGAVPPGASKVFTASVSGALPQALQWQRNGADIAGATGGSYERNGIQAADAGLYFAVAKHGAIVGRSDAAIVGLVTTSKVVGFAEELQPVDIRHPNGNIFDQVLLMGVAAAITADHSPNPALNQITRISYVDLDNDIVQVEFSGPGTLSLVLDQSSGPAAPVNYHQAVNYMKGHAGIVITGATERTNVSVFSVGRKTAVNQALFKSSVSYDGIADLAFIAILSANGKFGGVRTANANYFASKGLTGVYAPGVAFDGPVLIGDITAFDDAQPVIVLGTATDVSVAGGDMFQSNAQPVELRGIGHLKFTAGADSHGNLLPARSNKAFYHQDGVDVTSQIVAAP